MAVCTCGGAQVIQEGDDDDSATTEVMRNAVELAVMSSMSHPNIVQVRPAARPAVGLDGA